MTRLLIAALLWALASPLMADDRRVALGWGQLFSNDMLGDGRDRWRTASLTLSYLRGRPRGDKLPTKLGDVLEYRLRAEIISPANLSLPDPFDRPWAGTIAAGLHSYAATGPVEYRLGLDLVSVGPSTGLDDLQFDLHKRMKASLPSLETIEKQIDNTTRLMASGEIAHRFQPRPKLSFRPFAEAQLGVETLARIGGDLVIGDVGHNDLGVRDVVTGQRFPGIDRSPVGTSLVLGADVAYIGDSLYFPSYGPEARDTRRRFRASLKVKLSDRIGMHLGSTWLSEEFVGQSGEQQIGSVGFSFVF